jgi:iron complex outermembrane recepter protein
MRGLNIIASYAHLEHEVTASTNPAEIGRRLAQTPNDQAALWAMWEIQGGSLRGLGVGGGMRYIGRTYDLTKPTATPGYALFDTRVQYDLVNLSPQLRGFRLAVNGLNLADKYYLTQCTTGAGCTLWLGRTVLATLTYRW